MHLTAKSLHKEFLRVRNNSLALCEPLAIEDFSLQAMPSTSPPKWHLAHTSWFFETFILKPLIPDYQAFHPMYEQLFNSYYNSIGNPYPRPKRGLLSRPTVKEVYHYRESIDAKILNLLESHAEQAEVLTLIELGLHHEQQHQELILTDLKYSFNCNPLKPVYQQARQQPAYNAATPHLTWHEFAGGLIMLGAESDHFHFDNELPRHKHYLEPFALASRPISNQEYIEFIADKAYQRPELWLSDGWDTVCQQQWQAPLYWQQENNDWYQFTLQGYRKICPAEPVCHLSFYEADAYARWANARLPTEAEWEHCASSLAVAGNFLAAGHLQPQPAANQPGLQQIYGDVWEWTASSYSAYPGFQAKAGAVGEYNGKFMNNQMVLRGGSCVSDVNHIRYSYRNFFYPHEQWQFSGLRLAKSLKN